MTHPQGTRVTAGGKMGTVEGKYIDTYVDTQIMGTLLGYHVLWDDGSWTLESPDAIDVVER